MKRRITVEVELTSSSGDPAQLRYKLDEIVGSIERAAEYERLDEDNLIVYNDWEDPHVCELTISTKTENI